MPRVNRPLDEGTAHRSHARRLENRERATVKPDRPKVLEVATFNWDTPTVPSSYAALTPWPVILGGQVVELRCSAGTAASGSSTFKVRVNGTQVGSTMTFPASTTATTLYLGSVRVPPGANLHVEPVTIGTGLLGFVVVVVMKP